MEILDYKFLQLSTEGHIAILTISRPESLNALNKDVIQELTYAMLHLEKDENCRCIILTGSGEKAFVAGADIKEFADFTSEQASQLAKNGHENLFNVIENLTTPVIAAVNGFALGGGLELAMACHMRFASEDAKLGLPEVTLGIIPGYGGTQRLPQLVGKGRAAELIFTARMLDATTAKYWGLVNDVFAKENLLPEVKKIAEKISKNSPLAISKAIACINQSGKEFGFQLEITSFGELFEMKDKKEGVSAFLDKRKPNF